MADFKTHITTSTVLGIGYGTTGYLVLDAPLSTSMLSAALCGVSGMLPDIDSDSGIPLRESIAFGAAVVPMLMVDRLEHMGFDREAIVLAGAIMYVAIRFGVAEIIKKTTVHRGMWHSVPACAIAGLLAFMLCTCDDTFLRLYKMVAVVLGFMSHLLLDELYSIDFSRGSIRLKKSFGTAIKFWSKSGWANLTTYAKLAVISLAAFGEPLFSEYFETNPRSIHASAHDHSHGVDAAAASGESAGNASSKSNAHDASTKAPARTARTWLGDLIDSAASPFR